MKYSIDFLLENKSLNEDSYLFFWGHRPKKNGRIGNSCLSQWWKCKFEYNNISFNSTEQWMMSEKAELFGDVETKQKIILSESPKEIKELGREIKNFNESRWNRNKVNIVLYGNFMKFKQNVELSEYLISTDDKVIVETSPYDKIWGIGLSRDDRDVFTPSKWAGDNLLGFVLMEVRGYLKNNIQMEYSDFL